ncbi:hypothetical protein G9A89_007527 [Geosiphon pyriformis]|nr:hypothetical protein G9A89_007527 [Geosiphon pyriformis]
MESLSGEDENVSMFSVNDESLLGLAATTPKANSSLGSPNFHMDNNKVLLPSHLSISLEKKWIDPKIIKTPVEVSIRKSFALNINLSAVEGKSATAKTQVITPLKFEEIIQSTFTFKKSMNMVVLLAKVKEINVNSDLKKQRIHSDRAVVIKKIPINTPKEIIIATLAEFGKIKSIKIQLIGM